MHLYRKVTDELYWIGANDYRISLFENIHPVPQGVSYNSYLLLGKKTVLFDAVDWSACRNYLDSIEYLLDGRTLDYLVISHVEPDHGASIDEVLLRYPEVKIVATDKAFAFMRQFGFSIDEHELISAKNDGTLEVGDHTLKFIWAPMVHWPEVMVTLDMTTGALFTADAFGTFKTLDGRLFNDEVDFPHEYLDEARRYYFNIVGKYGPQVQMLLKKVSACMDKIQLICPLHGPVWRNNLSYILSLYDKWSRWESEEKGVAIVFASMYGNTENAALAVANELCSKGITNVRVFDVSKTSASDIIGYICKVSHVVIACCTYNLHIYPPMENLLNEMAGIGVQNKTFALIENGTWAIKAGDLIRAYIENNLKNNKLIEGKVTVTSSVNDKKEEELALFAQKIAEDYNL